MPSKKIKMTAAEELRAANAKKGTICNLPFWTCPKCDVETADDDHVACACGRPYKLDLGWVDVHKPVVRAMAAEGYVFPKGTVEWAHKFITPGYYAIINASIATQPGWVNVYTSEGIWLGAVDAIGNAMAMGHPDRPDESTVVRVGKLAIEHFGNTANQAAEV